MFAVPVDFGPVNMVCLCLPVFSAFSPGLNMVEPGQSETASSGNLSEITECGRVSQSSDR